MLPVTHLRCRSTDPSGSGVWEFSLPPSYNPPSTSGRKLVRIHRLSHSTPQVVALHSPGCRSPLPFGRVMGHWECVFQSRQMCLLARTENCEHLFWSKVKGKNENYLFYPSAKNRRDLKIKTSGVIFRDAPAYYVQTTIAPLKWAVCPNFRTKIFPTKIVSRKFSPKIIFGRRKFK